MALLSIPAKAQPVPDYTDSAGDWSIAGKVMDPGNTISCKMQRDSENGLAFAYVDILSVGSDGINVRALFVTESRLPDHATPTVSLSFDGIKQPPLPVRVQNGYLSIVLSANNDTLKLILDLFQFSDKLTERVSLKGHRDEITTVNLADAETGFAKAGQCMKVLLGMGVARMQQQLGR